MQARSEVPHVVIVGAGFGGLYCAQALKKLPVRITIIDRSNHHLFQPLLYQVATAGLSPGEIAEPIRGLLGSEPNVQVLLAEVAGFDVERRVVKLADQELGYDYLVMAAGVRHSYFGHDDWERFAPGLKSVEDALEIRRRVLLAFELAERAAAAHGHHEPLNFVVVGGGPTGVELAGALAEIARRVVAGEFKSIDPRRARILLIEAGPRILPSYPDDLSRSAEAQLRRLGVEVMVNTAVTGIAKDHVRLGDTTLPTAATIWAAGIVASPLGRALGAPLDRAGRVQVERDLSIPHHHEVFVIGDLAAFLDDNGKPLPGVAPVAIQQGQFVARQIKADLEKHSREHFRYHDKGSLATIGRAAAVADFGRLRFGGFFAWILWLFIHIYSLIGFRHKIIVMMQWGWAYITWSKSARLITASDAARVSEKEKEPVA